MISKTLFVRFAASIIGFAFVSTVDAGSLVSNGSFEQTQFNGVSYELGSNNWKPAGITGSGLTGWTNGSNAQGGSVYNLWFNASNATTVDAVSQYPSEPQRLSASFTGSSPDGGNFVAMDGDSKANGALSQQINGLTVGIDYRLSFYWGAIELSNRHGYTTESLNVSLGNSPTQVVSYGDPSGPDSQKLPSNAFTGWFQATMFFHADSTSELLSVLSVGTPNGLPPIALLDGVSLVEASAVPEPSSLALSALGFVGLVVCRARRRGATTSD